MSENETCNLYKALTGDYTYVDSSIGDVTLDTLTAMQNELIAYTSHCPISQLVKLYKAMQDLIAAAKQNESDKFICTATNVAGEWIDPKGSPSFHVSSKVEYPDDVIKRHELFA